MVFSIISPLILRSIIDDVLIGKNHQILIPLLAALSLLFILSFLASYFSNLITGKFGIILFTEISSKIFETIQQASLKKIQQLKIGDLQTRTVGNISPIVQIVSLTIPQLVIAIISIFVPFIIMYSLNPNLTFFVLSPIVLFVISSWYFGNAIKKMQKPILDSNASLSSFLKETFSILPLIKIFSLEEWINQKYKNKLLNYNNASFNGIKISALNSSTTLLLYSIPTIFVLTFGSYAVIDGSMSIGTLTAFMAYVGQFFSPINQISCFWSNYKSSQASYDRISEIFLFKKDRFGSQPLLMKPTKIEFDNVWFSYDNRTILKDYCATFEKGRNYLMGDNGSGKTTIISLICQLYYPEKGKILINGQDLNSIDRKSIKRSVSMVFSDSLIFDGTIFENIAVGNISASKEDIVLAAKKAELHEFIMKLPDKYETYVGESGLNMSSGEKQKIALARVILKDTPIIIFDEFTRSIDAVSKKQIFSVINQMTDKIIIIITHDSKDIEDNSNIVYVEKFKSILVQNFPIISSVERSKV